MKGWPPRFTHAAWPTKLHWRLFFYYWYYYRREDDNDERIWNQANVVVIASQYDNPVIEVPERPWPSDRQCETLPTDPETQQWLYEPEWPNYYSEMMK